MSISTLNSSKDAPQSACDRSYVRKGYDLGDEKSLGIWRQAWKASQKTTGGTKSDAEKLTTDQLGLSNRIKNCLKGEDVREVSELISHSAQQLRTWPNLGVKSLKEIEVALAMFGLSLKGAKRTVEAL